VLPDLSAAGWWEKERSANLLRPELSSFVEDIVYYR
jgi:hypothetical protein